jgi:hypothetical protein
LKYVGKITYLTQIRMPNVIRYLNSFRMAFPATRRPTL